MAIYVRDGLSFATIETSTFLPRDKTTEYMLLGSDCEGTPHERQHLEQTSMSITSIARPPASQRTTRVWTSSQWTPS